MTPTHTKRIVQHRYNNRDNDYSIVQVKYQPSYHNRRSYIIGNCRPREGLLVARIGCKEPSFDSRSVHLALTKDIHTVKISNTTHQRRHRIVQLHKYTDMI